MKRRTFLASATVLTGGLAGCLGGGSDGGTEDPNPDDGYPPADSVASETSTPADADPSSFKTTTTSDIEVPLVPVEVAHNWFQRRTARFVDARGGRQYQRNHIPGAVHSPAPTGRQENDPVNDWPDDARIVTYCGCPHHLSSQRAAALINSGRKKVYAIDEGFRPDNGGWLDRGYPSVGTGANVQSYEIRGRTDPADAGEYAWAVHDDGAQQEAAPIRDDGSYQMTLHFSDVGPSSPINLRTPSYELTAPLSELTDGVVDASLA